MSVQIQTINLEKRLVLSDDSVGAVMAVGTNWSIITVLMRAHFGDLGVNPGVGPQFKLGLMTTPTANMSNGPKSATTGHFVGMDSFTAGWTRNAGPPVYYSGLSMRALKKVGATETSSGINASVVSASPDRRLCYGIRLAKGSPNFTFNRIYPNAGALANALLDVNVNAMELENIVNQDNANSTRDRLNAITGTGAYTTQSSLIAVNESVDGVLDSLCVSWNRSTFEMYISDLVAMVIS